MNGMKFEILLSASQSQTTLQILCYVLNFFILLFVVPFFFVYFLLVVSFPNHHIIFYCRTRATSLSFRASFCFPHSQMAMGCNHQFILRHFVDKWNKKKLDFFFGSFGKLYGINLSSLERFFSSLFARYFICLAFGSIGAYL